MSQVQKSGQKLSFVAPPLGTKYIWYQIKAYSLYFVNLLAARLTTWSQGRYNYVFEGGWVGNNFVQYSLAMFKYSILLYSSMLYGGKRSDMLKIFLITNHTGV